MKTKTIYECSDLFNQIREIDNRIKVINEIGKLAATHKDFDLGGLLSIKINDPALKNREVKDTPSNIETSVFNWAYPSSKKEDPSIKLDYEVSNNEILLVLSFLMERLQETRKELILKSEQLINNI